MLDTETLSSFSNGAYLQWVVSGNIVITVTNLVGPSAVLSGLFIDPATPASVTTSAVFANRDTTTQGSWDGTYGSQGYDMVSNAVDLPSYAVITPSNALIDTWASSTTTAQA